MKVIRLEKDFESLLLSSARDLGYHIIPIPDDNKRSQAAGNQGAASRAAQKPYDFGILCEGTYFGIECKIAKGPTLYAAQIKPHQHTGLHEVSRSGGLAFLAIYFKFKKRGEVYEKAVMVQHPSNYEGNYEYMHCDPSVGKYQHLRVLEREEDTFDLRWMGGY